MATVANPTIEVNIPVQILFFTLPPGGVRAATVTPDRKVDVFDRRHMLVFGAVHQYRRARMDKTLSVLTRATSPVLR